jgi:hypothetical protein
MHESSIGQGGLLVSSSSGKVATRHEIAKPTGRMPALDAAHDSVTSQSGPAVAARMSLPAASAPCVNLPSLALLHRHNARAISAQLWLSISRMSGDRAAHRAWMRCALLVGFLLI